MRSGLGELLSSCIDETREYEGKPSAERKLHGDHNLILSNQETIMRALLDWENKKSGSRTEGNEKSCMTPKDCKECDDGCGLYDPTDVVGIKITIPNAPDLGDCNDCNTKSTKERQNIKEKTYCIGPNECSDCSGYEECASDLKKEQNQKPTKETLDSTKRSELKNKYNRHCKVCNLIAVHESSSSGVCPDCAAEIRTRMDAGRREMLDAGRKIIDNDGHYNKVVKQLKAERSDNQLKEVGETLLAIDKELKTEKGN